MQAPSCPPSSDAQHLLYLDIRSFFLAYTHHQIPCLEMLELQLGYKTDSLQPQSAFSVYKTRMTLATLKDEVVCPPQYSVPWPLSEL